MTKSSTLFFTDTYKKTLTERNKYTQDVPYLNQFQDHYIFTYGTLKRGNNRHDLLKGKGIQFCGSGVTKDTNFDLLLAETSDYVAGKPTTGTFPVAFNDLNKTRQAQLRGEVYLVPTDVLLALDRVESNGIMYDRVWKKIWVGKSLVNCFMYVGVKHFWQTAEIHDSPITMVNRVPYHVYDAAVAKKVVESQSQASVH